RVFAGEPDPLERLDASALLAGVPIVDRRKPGGGGVGPAPLDVASALGSESDALISGARLGVWTYRHGIGRERRDDMPYLRDIREGRLASHVALVRASHPGV